MISFLRQRFQKDSRFDSRCLLMLSFLPVFCGGFLVSSALLLSAAEEAQEKLNVLFIAIDDLRPELQCYGVEHIHSPNIDALAAKGMTFTSHYVQAPTCGASRYALLTGRYGLGGNNKELFNLSLIHI